MIVRFEAFGDTNNIIQAINYLNIARINPHARFAAWTKNPKHWAAAIQEVEKPDNLNLIYSSPRLNECAEDILERYPNTFDKIFTVYTKEFIEEFGVVINCGGKQCRQCGLCYLSDVKIINEVLK